jgi:hypothetical protein
MSDMPDLGKQIGPLPLGAWIAVVAGGLGIAYYGRRSGSQAAVTDAGVVDDTGTPDGTADGSVGGWTPTTPTGTTTDPGAPTDNDQWGNLAINYLISQGYDPAWSFSAITKALDGGRGSSKLSVREYALWRAALRHLGAPPIPVIVPAPGGLPGPHNGGGGGPKTPPIGRHEFVAGGANGKCRRCGHAKDNFIYHYRHQNTPSQPGANSYTYAIVTAKPLPGSTLKSMAQIYYRDGSKWHRIYDANRSGQRRADGSPGLIQDPNTLHVGWRLIIPKNA